MNLFTEYYHSPNHARQEELRFCLGKNLSHPLIEKVFLFMTTDFNVQHPKVEKVLLSERLRYSDFLQYLSDHKPVGVNILANADIWFDESLAKVKEFDLDKSTVCLTRYNEDGNLFSYVDSQDAWMTSRNDFPDEMIREAQFNLGISGCDNRIAGIFEKYGYYPVNPCDVIRSHHCHKSNFRTNKGKRIHGEYYYFLDRENYR